MIAIIGAGAIGSYLAYLLSKNNEDVLLFEEHKVIGKPVQCTGLVTKEILRFVDDEDVIINRIKKARIIAPNKEFIDVEFKNEDILVDRCKLDEYFCKLAVENMAKLYKNYRLINYKKINGKIELNFGKEKILVDELVGADGFNSIIARINNQKREFVKGIQARAKLKNNKEIMEIYLGIGEFAWIVPENNEIVRVGVISKENTLEHFKKFIKEKKCEIIEYQSGIIPIFNNKIKTRFDNVYLIGDAATMVKATSYGGILYGLMAAREFSKDRKNYEKNWRKLIGRELKLGLKIRKALNKFSDNDYNRLVELFKQDKLGKLLEEYTRDYPTRFVFKAFLKEPRLLKYMLKLL